MLEARSSDSILHPSYQVHIYHIQGMVGISVHLCKGQTLELEALSIVILMSQRN